MAKILLTGQSNPVLTRKIAKLAKVKLGQVEISQFPGGETHVQIKEKLAGKNVFLVQSCFNPTNEYLTELLVLIDAAKRLKPRKITAIIPFYPYRRQEKQRQVGESVTAQLVAKLLKAAGCHKVIAVELHSEKIAKFFDIPVTHLRTLPLMANYFTKKFKNPDDYLVVAPDQGSAKMSRELAKILKIPLVVVTKTRLTYNKVKITKLTGNVTDKNVILLDDEISTGGTICKVVEALKKQGVRDIYVAVTHGAFTDQAIQKISRVPIKEVVITDTVAQPKKYKKIKVLSVAELIAGEIK